METHATPIEANERIYTLDVIRGFALLGIFIMNMPGFSASLFARYGGVERNTPWWDSAADTARMALFAGKFNSMFSMLFAVGFTIQLSRLLERQPQRATGIYLRRIFWLFVLGVIHACVFWTGDVLHIYALFGLLLLALRRVPDRVVAGLIVLCLIFPAIAGTVRAALMTPETLQSFSAFMKELVVSADPIYARGSFTQIVRENTRLMGLVYGPEMFPRFYLNIYVTFLATVLLGLLLGRRRFFQNAASHLPFVRRVQWWALPVGLAAATIDAVWRATVKNPLEPSLFRTIAATAFGVSRVAIMIFFVCTIVRCVHNDRWRPWLEPLLLTGRMPLTNYLMQTLIATFLFYGWGLGWYGTTGAAVELLLAVTIFFVIQVPLSRLWLRRYSMGPIEYLWRALTYGRAALSSSQPAGRSEQLP